MTNVKNYALNSASSKQLDNMPYNDLIAIGQALAIPSNERSKTGTFSGHTYHIVITKARLSKVSKIPPSKNGGLAGDKRFHDPMLKMSRMSWSTLITYLKEATPSADIRLIAYLLRYGKCPKSYAKTLGSYDKPDFYKFLIDLRRWIIYGAINNRGGTFAHFNDNVKVYVNLSTNAIVYIELR